MGDDGDNDEFLYKNIVPENHDKIGRLNSEGKRQLHKIIKSGADVKFIILKKINGEDHIHILTFELEGRSFPKELSLPYLEELNVYGGFLNNSKFNFPELRNLNLRHMALTDLLFLSKHTKLEKIDFRDCNLTALPDIFNTLEVLQVLSIMDNKLTSLEGFEKLSKCINLTDLYLVNNKISDLLGFKPLSSLPSLKHINLISNKIKNLNITHEIPKLNSLLLSNSGIEHVSALYNQPSLRFLDFSENNIKELNFECFKNLPVLEKINVRDNPIELVKGLGNLPPTVQIEGVPDEYCEHSNPYLNSLGWECVYGSIKKTPKLHPDFIINEYLTLRMDRDNEIILYVKDEDFDYCAMVIINIPKDRLNSFENLNSIDEMVEENDMVPDSSYNNIPKETQFWAHASNLQAWAESNYDTRLLHRNIAFPLLKKLTDVGDPVAKKVFKEEIAKRYASGHHNVVKFLRKEGYLDYLNEEELASIRAK